MGAGVVMIGSGGHAVSITNVALSCGYSVIAYVDDNKVGMNLMGVPIISQQQCIELYPNQDFVIAIGDNSVRERVYLEYQSTLPRARFPSLVHQSSIVGFAAKVGDGTVVMPLVNIGPNSAVGRCCIVNTGALLDHDCTMADFSSLAPGVVCGGSVSIGIRSAISIGTSIMPGVKVGMDVVVGANSYVNKQVDDRLVAYGSPCKAVRERRKGDPYLG